MEIQKLKEMILSNDIDLIVLACTIVVQKELVDIISIDIERFVKCIYKDSFFIGWILTHTKLGDEILVYKNNKGLLIYYNHIYFYLM